MVYYYIQPKQHKQNAKVLMRICIIKQIKSAGKSKINKHTHTRSKCSYAIIDVSSEFVGCFVLGRQFGDVSTPDFDEQFCRIWRQKCFGGYDDVVRVAACVAEVQDVGVSIKRSDHDAVSHGDIWQVVEHASPIKPQRLSIASGDDCISCEHCITS